MTPRDDPDLERRLRRVSDLPGPSVPQSLYRYASELPQKTSGRALRPFGTSFFDVRIPKAFALAGICAVLVGAVAATGFLLSTNPDIANEPSASASASVSATQPGSPSPDATATPPAIGSEWGGLTWSSAVAAELPWGHVPGLMVEWHGRQIAVDTVGALGTTTGDLLVASSTDLAHWTTLASGKSAPLAGYQLTKLVAGPTQLVAFGFNAGYGCVGDPLISSAQCLAGISTSPDGASWTPVADITVFRGLDLIAVAGGSNGLVAVGSSGWEKPVMWYSATGSTWAKVALPESMFKAAHLGDVSAVPVGFVASGTIGGTDHSNENGYLGDWGGQAAGWWSPDGRTWAKASVELPQNGGVLLGHVYATAHGLVAVGANTRGDAPVDESWTSTDGKSWSTFTVASTYEVVPLDATSSRFGDGTRLLLVVAARDPNPAQIWETLDGVTWRALVSDGNTEATASLIDPVTAWVTEDGLIAFGTSGGDASQIVVLRASALSPGAVPSPTPATTPSGGIARSAALAAAGASSGLATSDGFKAATAIVVYGDRLSALVGARWIWQVTFVDPKGVTDWYDIDYYTGEVVDSRVGP